MRNKIEIKEEEHTFTSDQKLKWFGYGEWVEEFDHIRFEYMGCECIIFRVCLREPFVKEEYYFGGHLCGYVKIPKSHPYQSLSYSDMEIECHGGLTYGERHEGYWIGFDCGHSFDVVPSMEFTKTLDKETQELKKKFNLENSPIFQRHYRNVDYVIDQCVSIVDQLKNIAFTAKTKAAAEVLQDDKEENA